MKLNIAFILFIAAGVVNAQSFLEINYTNEADLVTVINASKEDQSRKKTFFALLKLGSLYLNENKIPKCDSVLTIIEGDFKDLITQGVRWRTLDVSDYYHLLSSLYYLKNDNKKSKFFLEKAQRQNPDVFSYTNNLYRLFIREGKLDSAEYYLQHSFPVLAKNLDIHKLDGELLNSFHLTFMNMCELKIKQGDVEGFQYYLSKWLHISKSKINNAKRLKKIKLLPWQLLYLSKYYIVRGDTARSNAVLERASQIPADHRLKLETLRCWAQLYYTKNDTERTIHYLKETLSFHKENVKLYFPILTEIERENYINELNDDYEFLLSVISENSDLNKQHLSELFEFQLFRKGLLLDVTKKLNKLTFNLKDGQAGKLMEQIASVNDSIAILTFKKSVFTSESKELLLARLHALKESREKSLLRLVRRESVKLFTDISVQEITHKLAKESCLVEVIRFRKWVKDPNRIMAKAELSYAVLVISPEKSPEFILIPNAEELEGRYAKFYKNSIQFRIDDTRLHEVYWSKIYNAISSYKKVFLSPDGIYNVININTLQNPNTHQFVLDEMQLINLTSPKDLMEDSTQSIVNNSALLLGYPLYSFSNPENNKQASFRGAILENLESIKTEEFDALPGTLTEIEEIIKIIHKKNGSSVVLEGKDATETNLKSSKIPDILHLATHGFFISAENYFVNPLLKSGLVLAGVNNKTYDESTEEDGILTAFEIAALNLKNTKLVVLSACETGLGEIKNGDGVYGLQRAFKLAEAKYLILSMWKVDDEATMKLMTLFYTHLMETNDVVSSFNRAQKELRNTYPAPYYWGAFKLIGY
jgi:hypothetical protein